MFKNLFRACPVIIIGIMIVSSLPSHISIAAAGDVKWSPVTIPVNGEAGKWTLASGADTKCLTMAEDGTLYCYANPTGTTDTLFKSTDGGLSWSSIGQVKDAIIAIAVVPNDVMTLYYATTSSVYRSGDSGASFIPLPQNPGGAGNHNVQITSLDVVRLGNSNLVAVGTKDTDFGNYGGVYLFDESSSAGIWLNTSIGANDVYRIAFSPNYVNDKVLIVVASDKTATFIKSQTGDNDWTQMVSNERLPDVPPVSATIAFPNDYAVSSSFFLALDTGIDSGDVYRIVPIFTPLPDAVIALGIGSEEGLSGVDITSLAIAGDTISATMIAGCARQTRTYISSDGGVQWIRSQKPPTGQSNICVVMAPDFINQQKAYAVTCGAESGFSVSDDSGMTWRQVSLIDSKITSLVDFTFSPADDGTVLFLITHNSTTLKYSLWRSQDGGNHWQRMFSSNLPGIDAFYLVKATGDGYLFLAGQSNGNPVLWYSADKGQTFTLHPAPCAVDTWAFVDKSTFFIGGYDGVKGVVYRTDNGGIFYSVPIEAGTRTLTTIVFSPEYLQDGAILAGNTGGQVFFSDNGGVSFWQIGQQLPVTAGTGRVGLAFDRNFSKNNIVYASVDTKTTSSSKERLFHFTIGESTAWQSMYSSLPENAVISRIAVTNDGTFYTVNGQGVVTADGKGGLLRSLAPASQPAFEITTRGLDETATLNGLWMNKYQLWSFDTKSIALMTLVDSLTVPVALVSPTDGATGTGTDIRLEWQAITGATEYEWQINDETSFSSLPAGFSSTTTTTSARLTTLKPAITYYWRVRATKPFQSPWSITQSFTTLLGGANVAPVLSFPEAGSTTSPNPIFLWQTVPGADRYELLVCNDTTFASPVVCCAGDKALLANAWKCETSLEYGTTYFWKVRACTTINTGEWSAINVFTTEPAPVVVDGLDSGQQEQPSAQQITVLTPEPQQPSSSTIIQLGIPNWVLYAGLALIVIIVILLAAFILVVFRSRRL
jgi:photosystem II stability/assembly factor-like uncharacterized protein